MPRCEWKDNDTAPRCGRLGYKDRSYCPDHVWLIYQKGTGYKPSKPKVKEEVETIK